MVPESTNLSFNISYSGYTRCMDINSVTITSSGSTGQSKEPSSRAEPRPQPAGLAKEDQTLGAIG